MKQRNKAYLKAEASYRFLLELDDKLDTKIKCKNPNANLVTTDQSLYEAIGAVKDKSSINMNNLTKLLEVVEIVPYKKLMKKKRKVLKPERAEEIRNQAKKNTEEDKNE